MRPLGLAALLWIAWVWVVIPAPRPADRQVPVAPQVRAPLVASYPSPAVASTAETRPTTASGPVARFVAPPAPPVASKPASLSGRATWYCLVGRSPCTRGHPDTAGADLFAAAGPALRQWLGPRWRGMTVRVCAANACVNVRLIDACGAGCRSVVDLYGDAFRALAPLPAGVVTVTIR